MRRARRLIAVAAALTSAFVPPAAARWIRHLVPEASATFFWGRRPTPTR
jgi:hypothetical protein